MGFPAEVEGSSLATTLADGRPTGLRARMPAYVPDLIAFALLALAGWYYLLRHAGSIGMTHDGFLLSFLQERGVLPSVVLDPPEYLGKIAGRPFIGLPWNLAALLTGGTLTGYNAFQLSTILASAMLVFLIVRILLPARWGWALAAGMLKLAWSANEQIFANHSLAIYFTEMLLWLAAALFAMLLRYGTSLRLGSRVALLTGMGCAVYVVILTYESAWPLTCLIPVIAWVLHPRWPFPHGVAGVAVAWYGPLGIGLATYAAIFFWSPVVGQELTNQASLVSEGTFLPLLWHRLGTGLGAVLDGSFVAPLREGLHWLGGYRGGPHVLIAPSAPIIGAALAIGTVALMQVPEQAWCQGTGPLRSLQSRVAAVLLTAGVVIMLVGILPPAMKFDDFVAGRLIHFSMVGAIMMVVGLAMYLSRLGRISGGVAIGVLLVPLLWGHLFRLDQLANRYSNLGRSQRDLVAQIAAVAPAVAEGTVLVLEGAPPKFHFDDRHSSLILRALTNTRRTFMLTEHRAAPTTDGRAVVVSTTLSLDEAYQWPGGDLEYPRIGPLKAQTLERSRVIRLVWRQGEKRLGLVEPELDRAKILPGESAYGIRLFGEAARARPSR